MVLYNHVHGCNNFMSYVITRSELDMDRICANFLSVFSVLLGQGMELSSRLKPALRALVTVWILITIVISNGHSGIVTTVMTKEIVPPHPTTAEQILEDAMPLFILSSGFHTAIN